MTKCPVCANTKLIKTIFNPGSQPLASVGLPHTRGQAINVLRYPMEYARCQVCSHVWNILFDEAKIPYGQDSNLMYNKGPRWQKHLHEVARILTDGLTKFFSAKETAHVIDIGCADGQFFDVLRKQLPETVFTGFEPGVDALRCADHEVVRDYFVPERDLYEHSPEVIVCRHVLEHLTAPREFLLDLAYWCYEYGKRPLCIFEVPKFDTALEQSRLCDFQYEHVSNFTYASFNTLLKLSEFDILEQRSMYEDEVSLAVCRPRGQTFNLARVPMLWGGRADSNMIQNLKDDLWYIAQQYGNAVWLWGGGGKGAALINILGLNSDQYPNVVDSDPAKWGRHVPGTGQKITAPTLYNKGAVVILTPWRAGDITEEIRSLGFEGDIYTLGTREWIKI